MAGWITIKSSQGSPFVRSTRIKYPSEAFTEEVCEEIVEPIGNVARSQTFLDMKIKRASYHPSGPVTEAQLTTEDELEKSKPQANESHKVLKTLRKEVHQGKKSHNTAEAIYW